MPTTAGPTLAQLRDLTAAAHHALRSGWDHDPLVLSLYLDPEDPAQGDLHWGNVPIPASAWRNTHPEHLIRNLAESLGRPEAFYTMSSEDSWPRWCGLLGVVEVMEADCDSENPEELAAVMAALDAGTASLTQTRLAVAVAYTDMDHPIPSVLAASWPENGEMRWDYGEDIQPYNGDMGSLADTLYQMASALHGMRARVMASDLDGAQRPTTLHTLAELTSAAASIGH